MPTQNQRSGSPANTVLIVVFALVVSLVSSSLRADVVVAKNTPSALGTKIVIANNHPTIALTFSKYASTGFAWFNFNDESGFACSNQTDMRKLSDKRAFVNWHPFSNQFRVSAGAFVSEENISIINRPLISGSAAIIGGNAYSAACVGTVRGDVELSRNIEPYLGIGWSKQPAKRGIGCFIDFGFLFTSAPKTTLSASGQLAADAGFRQSLQAEANRISHDLKPARYYPIAQAGLLYRF